ncbi:MAG: hypothetical protein AAGE59_39370, partial [Cyanobacteria bacterium P01_F01_bin.86]
VHGGHQLICAMHPYGPENEKCGDWEAKLKQESRINLTGTVSRFEYQTGSRMGVIWPREPEVWAALLPQGMFSAFFDMDWLHGVRGVWRFDCPDVRWADSGECLQTFALEGWDAPFIASRIR